MCIPNDAIAQRCFVSDSISLHPSGKGSLESRTFVVKDLFAVAGHTSSFGNARWRETHQRSDTTASAVTKILNSGASLVGLTKMDQLAASMVGNVSEDEPPINPLYNDRFTGGSSSGSASAVAAKLADFGIGTDTSGSIRVPAASCGLFALRPTYGAIDIQGAIPWAQSFDTVGILTRGSSLLLEVFNVLNSGPNNGAAKPKAIVLPKECLKLASPDVSETMVAVATALSGKLGIEIKEMDFGKLTDPSITDLFTRLQQREIWKNHGEWILKNRQFLDPGVQSRLERAEKMSMSPQAEKDNDINARKKYGERYEKAVTSGLMVIMPIMPDLPPKTDASAEELTQFRLSSLRLCSPAGLAGAPEAVIPVKNKHTRLTHGIGILGRRGEDRMILAAIASVFNETPQL